MLPGAAETRKSKDVENVVTQGIKLKIVMLNQRILNVSTANAVIT